MELLVFCDMLSWGQPFAALYLCRIYLSFGLLLDNNKLSLLKHLFKSLYLLFVKGLLQILRGKNEEILTSELGGC